MTKFTRAFPSWLSFKLCDFGNWMQIFYATLPHLQILCDGILCRGRGANLVALFRRPREWAEKKLDAFRPNIWIPSLYLFAFAAFLCALLPSRPLYPLLSVPPLVVCSARRCFVRTLCELLASPAALSMHSSICLVRLGLDLCVYFMYVVVLPKMFPVHDSGCMPKTDHWITQCWFMCVANAVSIVIRIGLVDSPPSWALPNLIWCHVVLHMKSTGH